MSYLTNPYMVSPLIVSPHCYSEANTSKGFNANRSRSAMKITSSHILADKDISSVSIYTEKDVAGSSGTCYVRIYNNANSLVGTIGSYDISTLDVYVDPNTPDFEAIFSGSTITMPVAGGYLSLDGVSGQQVYALNDSGTEDNAVLSFYNPNTSSWSDQTGEGLRYCATFT